MKEFFEKNRIVVNIAFLVVAIAIGVIVGSDFHSFRTYEEEIRPGEGVTDSFMLSDYFAPLKDTYMDSRVYVMQGKEEGASLLVLGGTHPNEPSAHTSAIVLIESGVVEAGTVYVMPRTNNSAFTHNDSQEGSPHFFHIENQYGETREFVFGSRATNPLDQWPDPDVYVHQASGQNLSGSETRNINRAYPGVADGTPTEQAALAIVEMIKALDIDMTIDLHEASPEYPTINATVAHEDAMTVASMGILEIMMQEIDMSLEPSPPSLRGLTHRELGDYTDTLALLMETGNASQGRLRGATNEQLILTGVDKFYTKARELGYVYIPYDDSGVRLEERVGRHIQGIVEYCKAYGDVYGENITITGIPTYQELMDGHSIGEWLN